MLGAAASAMLGPAGLRVVRRFRPESRLDFPQVVQGDGVHVGQMRHQRSPMAIEEKKHMETLSPGKTEVYRFVIQINPDAET